MEAGTWTPIIARSLIAAASLLMALAATAQEPVHIVNRWKPDHALHVDGGVPKAGPVMGNPASADWLIEPTGEAPYVRLRHRETGAFLHMENQRLELGRIKPGWFSAMWVLEAVDGPEPYYRLGNRWLEQYLHIEYGPAEVGAIEPGWWSAMWALNEPPQLPDQAPADTDADNGRDPLALVEAAAGFGPIRLGMTQPQVEAILGPPEGISDFETPAPGSRYLKYGSLGIDVMLMPRGPGELRTVTIFMHTAAGCEAGTNQPFRGFPPGPFETYRNPDGDRLLERYGPPAEVYEDNWGPCKKIKLTWPGIGFTVDAQSGELIFMTVLEQN